MNTGKQINVMLGLLMVFAIATLLYFLWDTVRAEHAEERQLTVDAERGGKLFSLNCRACHGITGKGVLENPTLPGVPLNMDTNRPTDPGKLTQLQARVRDTIRCGRVGTIMPAWSQEQFGPLNDFQIQQLVLLITSAASEEGWRHAQEVANSPSPEGDEFGPPKALAQGASDSDTTFVLNDARNLKPTDLLRIEDDPEDDVYELVTVIDSPAGSVLTDNISAEQTALPVQAASVFRPGDKLIIEDERMDVKSAPAASTLAADIGASDTALSLDSVTGFSAGETVIVEQEKMKIVSVSGPSGEGLRVERGAGDTEVKEHKAEAAVTEVGDSITVQRGADNTKAEEHRAKTPLYEIGDSIQVGRGANGSTAAAHEAGAEVFVGPIPPANTVTGGAGQQGFPPCGQKTAAGPATPAAGGSTAPTPSAGQAEKPAAAQEVQATFTEPASGVIETESKDNFFSLNNFQVKAGEEVSIKVKNSGSAPHNLRVAGVDGQFKTGDDFATTPDLITAGGSGELKMKLAQAGTYVFRCDFHPNDMWGQITTE